MSSCNYTASSPYVHWQLPGRREQIKKAVLRLRLHRLIATWSQVFNGIPYKSYGMQIEHCSNLSCFILVTRSSTNMAADIRRLTVCIEFRRPVVIACSSLGKNLSKLSADLPS